MKMSGERIIPAPQARVWEALNDPEILRQSIPGCQEIIKHSPTELSAKVLAKVGPVKANFAGDVSLSKLNPPHSYLISGKGSGGAAGFAEGGADVRLETVDGGTKLVYDVEAKVGGKLAQIGSRLIDSTARRMADQFFKRFAEVVTDGQAQAESGPEAPPAAAEDARAPVKQVTAKKAPAAKKTAAKKSAAKKSAKGKPGARPTRDQSEPPPEFGAGPETAQPPSVMPEAAIAASASRRDEPRQAEPQQPPPVPGNNIWWLVGAGIAALLVILVLANF